MTKFKVGDLVVALKSTDNRSIIKGNTYKVHSTQCDSYGNHRIKFLDENRNLNGWVEEYFILEKDYDLRDLLQIGYKVEYSDGSSSILDSQEPLEFEYKTSNSDLTGRGIYLDIITIYKPKYNGLKPMEWVKVWERKEEPLYTLELPDCYYAKKYLEFCMEDTTKYRPIGKGKLTRKRKVDIDSLGYQPETFKSIFTQKEIDELPNQDFIKALIKKKVEKEGEL